MRNGLRPASGPLKNLAQSFKPEINSNLHFFSKERLDKRFRVYRAGLFVYRFPKICC